jgi:salicylate hydroxylase
MQTPNESVLIIGAGPAGLVTAITLKQKFGIKALVVDKAQKPDLMKDVGGAYYLSGNVINVLENLGMLPEIENLNGLVTGFNFAKPGGYHVRSLEFPPTAKMHGIRRSELQRILLSKLDEDQLICGQEVKSASLSDELQTVELADGTRLAGRVLIGADGIHSLLVKEVAGNLKTHFQQAVSYWGFYHCDEPTFERVTRKLPPGKVLSFKAPGMVLGIGMKPDRVGIWAIMKHCPDDNRNVHIPSDRNQLKALIAKYVKDIIKAKFADQFIELTDPNDIGSTFLCDRDPIDKWWKGSCLLIGDAAHPMTPYIGQGANSAILDAVVIGTMLGKLFTNDNLNAESLEKTFQEFFELRHPPTSANILKSRQAGTFTLGAGTVANWIYHTMMGIVPQSLFSMSITTADLPNAKSLEAVGIQPNSY